MTLPRGTGGSIYATPVRVDEPPEARSNAGRFVDHNLLEAERPILVAELRKRHKSPMSKAERDG